MFLIYIHIIITMTTCDFCKKRKVNIIPYKCKCGLQRLCTKCRYPETHNCSYDFKAEGKLLIEKNNPHIIAKKIESF
jgi:predicted nucleic acid binding AN1-type Zn finger protein